MHTQVTVDATAFARHTSNCKPYGEATHCWPPWGFSFPAEFHQGAPGGAKMANGIVKEKELLKATGYTARGRLVSHLERHNIPYFIGNRGQVWTTIEAINRALLPEHDNEKIDF